MTASTAYGAPSAFRILFDPSGARREFACRAGRSVLREMERQGLSWVCVGCRGGGCGICKIRVLSGEFRSGPMSRAHVSAEDQESGRQVLACQVFPETDLQIERVFARPDGIGESATADE